MRGVRRSVIMVLLPLTRGHRRHSVHRIASYRHGGKRFLTVTLDLGLGGMKIRTHHYLPEGEHLDFRLVLGSESIWLRGRIVYSRILSDQESVSGVEFVELSGQDHAALQDYLSTLEELPKSRDMLSAGEEAGLGRDRRRTGEE